MQTLLIQLNAIMHKPLKPNEANVYYGVCSGFGMMPLSVLLVWLSSAKGRQKNYGSMCDIKKIRI
jgi:hypothetical protein